MSRTEHTAVDRRGTSGTRWGRGAALGRLAALLCALLALGIASASVAGAQERVVPTTEEWIIGVPKAWVFQDGGMLVATRFLIAPTISADDISDIHDIGWWTVEPSTASEGGSWPIVAPHRMPGATVVTRYAGVILLYHTNAYTVPQGGLNANAVNHSDWAVRVNANPSVYGPGVGISTSFRPTWYLDSAREARHEFVALFDDAGLDAGAALVSEGELRDIGQVYARDLLGNVDKLIPGAFVEAARARPAPNLPAFTDGQMIMDSSDDNAPTYIEDALTSGGELTNTNAGFVGFLMVLGLGIAAAVTVRHITGELETGIVTVWAAMVGGWSVGWVETSWIAALAITAGVVIAWGAWWKRA